MRVERGQVSVAFGNWDGHRTLVSFLFWIWDVGMIAACFCKPLYFAKLEDPLLCGFGLAHDRQMPQILTQEPVTQRGRERGASFLEAAPVATTFSFQKQRNRGPGGHQGVLPAAVARPSGELC